MSLPIYKYTALGNDMLVIDPAQWSRPFIPGMAPKLCDRHFGVGADGICYGPLPHANGHAMRFFNPDGSEAEKSGNGLRIMARYLWDNGYAQSNPFTLVIAEDTITAHILDNTAVTIALSMGKLTTFPPHQLTIDGHTLTLMPASIGNPHAIRFTDHLDTLHQLGEAIATHPTFPSGTNVQFVQILNRHAIRIEIWERGAGYTMASGTSACAAAGTAVTLGYCLSPVTVYMAGGQATVTLSEEGQATLTGTVHPIFSGTLASDFFDQ
ncbi:MAG: diaminopimelate epimerase [Candidatus Promineifilaceae bacterium]